MMLSSRYVDVGSLRRVNSVTERQTAFQLYIDLLKILPSKFLGCSSIFARVNISAGQAHLQNHKISISWASTRLFFVVECPTRKWSVWSSFGWIFSF